MRSELSFFPALQLLFFPWQYTFFPMQCTKNIVRHKKKLCLVLTIVYQQPHTYAWTKWSFKLCVCVCGESGKNFVRVKCILDAQECLMCCCNNCICIEKSVEEVKVPTLYIFSTHCYTFFSWDFLFAFETVVKQLPNNLPHLLCENGENEKSCAEVKWLSWQTGERRAFSLPTHAFNTSKRGNFS